MANRRLRSPGWMGSHSLLSKDTLSARDVLSPPSLTSALVPHGGSHWLRPYRSTLHTTLGDLVRPSRCSSAKLPAVANVMPHAPFSHPPPVPQRQNYQLSASPAQLVGPANLLRLQTAQRDCNGPTIRACFDLIPLSSFVSRIAPRWLRTSRTALSPRRA